MNILLLVVFLSNALSTVEISGSIKDRFGNPIAEAKVCTESWYCTKSDSDGTYRIENILNRDMIWFSHSGYKPVIAKIGSSPMSIVLERADPSETEWSLPQCKTPTPKSGRYISDAPLKVFVPEGIQIYESRDVDYWMAGILYGPKKELLRIGSGSNWACFPKWPEIVKTLANREIIWSSDESYTGIDVCVDIRGSSEEGKFWRFTGNAFDAREYEGVSKEAAEEFDKIIDTLCVLSIR